MKYLDEELVYIGGRLYPYGEISTLDELARADAKAKPLPWQNIAATLAGNLRRAGYRVDGACVDADGTMWFWHGEKPTAKPWYTGWEISPNHHTHDSIRVVVPRGTDWMDMIIEFPKEGE